MNPGTFVTVTGWTHGVGEYIDADPGRGLWVLILVSVILNVILWSCINYGSPSQTGGSYAKAR